MKRLIKKSLYIGFLSTCLIGVQSCTKLEENPYSEIREDQFLNNRREVLQEALRPFTHMQAWLGLNSSDGYYYHNELSADQLAWPQKGRHGYDAGDHFRQHYHTWTDNESRMRQCWILMWTGLGYVNNAIKNIEKVNAAEIGMEQDELTSIIAELKVLRAYRETVRPVAPVAGIHGGSRGPIGTHSGLRRWQTERFPGSAGRPACAAAPGVPGPGRAFLFHRA